MRSLVRLSLQLSCRHTLPRTRPLSRTITNSPLKQTPSSSRRSHTVKGAIITNHLRLNSAHIGQIIEPPYENTLNDGVRVLWQSTFYGHDRIYTSHPFAQSLGLPSCPLPYSMMLFAAISMSHVDDSRSVLDLEYSNACYVRPAYAGDTFRQCFQITALRNTNDKENSIVTVRCELTNQRGQAVFVVDKTMLYPGVTHRFKESSKQLQSNSQAPKPRSHLLDHILYNGDTLIHPSNNHATNQPMNHSTHSSVNQSINQPIDQATLLIHNRGRPMGDAANMALSTLFRWTHPSIYRSTEQAYHSNNHSHNQANDQASDQSTNQSISIGTHQSTNQPIVPGGLVLSLTMSAATGAFEILHEQIDACAIINRVTPTDTISAMTYVQSINQFKEGFEELHLVTLGLKNVDPKTLEGVDIPLEIFTRKMRPRVMEVFLAENFPSLQGKIVTQIFRRCVRQSPSASSHMIPLL